MFVGNIWGYYDYEYFLKLYNDLWVCFMEKYLYLFYL